MAPCSKKTNDERTNDCLFGETMNPRSKSRAVLALVHAISIAAPGALELCDAVEGDELGYSVDSVLVSDFIKPAWYEPTCADRLDFKKHVPKELELVRGGYISIFDTTSGWTQINARGEGGPRLVAGSRRQRRKLIRRGGRASTSAQAADGMLYFRLQRTPSLVCSTRMPAAAKLARMASDTAKFLALRAASISATF